MKNAEILSHLGCFVCLKEGQLFWPGLPMVGWTPPSRSCPMVYPPPYLKMKPLTSEKQPPQFKIEATFQEMIPRKSAINSNLLKSLKNMWDQVYFYF